MVPAPATRLGETETGLLIRRTWSGSCVSGKVSNGRQRGVALVVLLAHFSWSPREDPG